MSNREHLTLKNIAHFLDAELKGDGEQVITGLSTLSEAVSGELSFLANPSYQDQLASTQASAVIVHRNQADEFKGAVLILDNPYLGYAKVSSLFDTLPKPSGQIHASAVISDSVNLGRNVTIGANVVIEEYAHIGDDVTIGAGSIIGKECRIGAGTRLHANVTLYHQVTLGERCILHSGAVLGADGFGFANEGGHWHKICQIGGVRVGNDVEIGANTTIDRGALSDTIIGDGVKLDNQIQIAHNVEVGNHTAMAACVGVAGSSKIGAHCTLAGGVGIAGHLNLIDGTHVTGMTMITRNTTEPGSYSSGTAMQTSADWKKSAARIRQLDSMAKRLKVLEKTLEGKTDV